MLFSGVLDFGEKIERKIVWEKLISLIYSRFGFVLLFVFPKRLLPSLKKDSDEYSYHSFCLAKLFIYISCYFEVPGGSQGSVGLKIEFVPISKQMRSISEYKSPVFLYCFFKNIKFETSSRLFLDICVILSQVSYAFLYFFLFFIYVISYQVADYPAMSFIFSINLI